MFYTSNDMPVEESSFEDSYDQIDRDAKLTLVVPTEQLSSFRHKIGRIQKQAEFEQEKRERFESLTKREVEIVSLLATGYDNPCIAESLFISRNTVEQHRKNIRRKLEVQSFVHLMEYALAFNLV